MFSSTDLALIISIFFIFFSNIFDKCVFPEPVEPKTLSHLLDQFGQFSINLYAEKLLLET